MNERMAEEQACVFCRMVRGEIPVEKLAESPYAFLIRDIHPQAPVHVLAIQKTHVPDMSAQLTFPAVLILATEWAKVNLPNGYRIVTNIGGDAGQTVKHLHFHVLGGGPLGGMT